MTGTTSMTFHDGCLIASVVILGALAGLALAELATQFLGRFWRLK